MFPSDRRSENVPGWQRRVRWMTVCSTFRRATGSVWAINGVVQVTGRSVACVHVGATASVELVMCAIHHRQTPFAVVDGTLRDLSAVSVFCRATGAPAAGNPGFATLAWWRTVALGACTLCGEHG